METRNLTMVVVNGEYKVAQYGQWDGYPDGQGLTALEFLRSQFDRKTFLARLAESFIPTDEHIDAMYRSAGATEEAISSGMINMDVSARFKLANPSLSRDTAANILSLIQDSTEPVPLRTNVDYAADSLSCEWGYVIDLDKNTFEVFKGANTAPLTDGERFASLALPDDRPTFNGEGDTKYSYFQIKLAVEWPLAALPSDEEFLGEFASDDEESEA